MYNDSDGDVYKVFNESKKNKAQEALDTIESRIQNNFSRFQVERTCCYSLAQAQWSSPWSPVYMVSHLLCMAMVLVCVDLLK